MSIDNIVYYTSYHTSFIELFYRTVYNSGLKSVLNKMLCTLIIIIVDKKKENLLFDETMLCFVGDYSYESIRILDVSLLLHFVLSIVENNQVPSYRYTNRQKLCITTAIRAGSAHCAHVISILLIIFNHYNSYCPYWQRTTAY